MKSFFKKYDLIKIAGILVLLTVVLTWIIPSGYFSGTELTTEEIKRVGLTNFMQYGLLGMYYFTVLITFLFVLGGFYQVLSKTAGYQSLVKGISKKMKGHEILFAVIISVVLAVLTSMANEYFPILVIIPLLITILERLKVDKISAFSVTFGALLVGTIGSVYSGKVAGYLNSTFTDSYIIVKILLLIFALVLLNVFTVLRMKKTMKSKEFSEYDRFEIETVKSSKSNPVKRPYIVGGILILLTTILAYLPWETWGVTVFASITEWVNGLSLFGVPIVSYVFGDFLAFGTWDIFTIQFVMLFAVLLIHWFGKVSLDEVFASFGEGFKKMSYVVIVLLFVYAVLEFAVMFPVIPVMVDWIAGLAKGFNCVLAFLGAAVASLFGVEMQYVTNLAGTYFAATYPKRLDILSIIFQSAFGLVSFCAPSSAILMLGLAYLDIPYKDWMKYIWKFILSMLVIVFVIIAIMLLAVL